MRGLKDSVRAEIKKPIVAGGDHHAIFFVSRIRALDNLTERGYVGGQPKAFALTESGRNLFMRLIAQLGKFEAEQLSGISQQDLAVTRRVLEKLYDRLRSS